MIGLEIDCPPLEYKRCVRRLEVILEAENQFFLDIKSEYRSIGGVLLAKESPR